MEGEGGRTKIVVEDTGERRGMRGMRIKWDRERCMVELKLRRSLFLSLFFFGFGFGLCLFLFLSLFLVFPYDRFFCFSFNLYYLFRV